MSPILKSNKQIRQVEALIGDASEEDAEEMLEAAYYEIIVPIAKERLDKFNRTLNKFLSSSKFRKLSEKPKFMSQIKKLDGLESKVVKRGKKLTQIGDLVRGAILFKNPEEVEMFVEEFRRKNKALISDYEFKKRGKDPQFGYFGSHHLDLMIDGLVVELQVMTKKLWSYKEAAHEIYKNLRDADRVADTFDSRLSKMLFDLGNKPGYRREGYMGEQEEDDLMDRELLRQMYEEDAFGDMYDSEDDGYDDIDSVYERACQYNK